MKAEITIADDKLTKLISELVYDVIDIAHQLKFKHNENPSNEEILFLESIFFFAYTKISNTDQKNAISILQQVSNNKIIQYESLEQRKQYKILADLFISAFKRSITKAYKKEIYQLSKNKHAPFYSHILYPLIYRINENSRKIETILNVDFYAEIKYQRRNKILTNVLRLRLIKNIMI